MSDRNQLVKDNFIRFVKTGKFPEPLSLTSVTTSGLNESQILDLFESQLISRHLDLYSRVMQKNKQSFYTIGSAGHEANAAYGLAFKPDDIAFLHYRSGAFMVQRAKNAKVDIIKDMLLSFAASSEDPISGGRHKVLGSKPLFIPPQTSTIASHLPKAVGTAFSIPLAQRIEQKGKLANDSVVLCNFGDASANHSTAQGALNSAAWISFQSVPLPIVFICEDNGIGISTATPTGWIEANYQHRCGLKYFSCDGLSVLDTYKMTKEAVDYAREHQKPVFLHVKLIRLLGHAGSDSEFVYRHLEDIEATEFQDPLLHSARMLLASGLMTKEALVDKYHEIEQLVITKAQQVITQPKLATAKEVMASIIPPKSELQQPNIIDETQREKLFVHERHNLEKKQHLAKLLNWALIDLMGQYPAIVMCGEDIGKKGGVYNVTHKLYDLYGSNRVVNTPLDEQTILGGAIGLAHNGLLPMPEIQFLAYVHNAEDQIRGEAATLSFFSNGQFTNPMVIRVAGLAYQKGFGGHFHNDNSFAVFRDIPGVIIACPSNGEDGVEMLRNCVRLAHEEQRIVVFLEPIALYMTKDLHQENDGLWTFNYPKQTSLSALEASQQLTVKASGQGRSLCILSYGNGYYLARQAQQILEQEGIDLRVVDLRYLAPLDEKGILAHVNECQHTLIVDECRQTGSISEALMTLIAESGYDMNHVARLCAQDSFIPLGSAAYHVLPSTQLIVERAKQLVQQ
ncbi:dehydrogenase E1 component subunit alpha/beta [Thalassotalea eurytherma]|uniref:3-methyl-2-oxobutanoate dehydrogenase (2-methylpropanoyl-transferring) n=1 Tax=Thalassotalea eurytherma TaxID=1144278 RepID=A0ABQ6H451_9GAMM|nr:thiamine pyrophosphate-dependent enzyme [Thalassotalea eurytherma]GLX81587.1 MFS transporter [Thalassotalea eurytherma]